MIKVSDNVEVEKISVSILEQIGSSLSGPGINHTYVGDLTVSLTSPQGTVVELIRDACEKYDDIEVVFSDQGEAFDCNRFNPAISGVKKGFEELSAFAGESAQGDWTLTVADNQDNDIGTLDGWGLEICSSEEVLGLKDYAFDDFKIYPNPSSGIFTVRFRSEEIDDVNVQLYDLLGRALGEYTFKSRTFEFEQQLNLSTFSNGIYIGFKFL